MIKNDSQGPSCTCPSGDGSLVHPCPAHPAVEQAGGDERAKFEYWASDEGIYPKAVERSGNCYKLAQTQSYWMAWQARAALAQPSPAQTQPSPAPTLRAAIDVANDRFEVPVAKWGTDLVGEEERPEVVAYFDRNYPSTGDAFIWANYEGSPYEPVMTVAQHARIVGALRAENAKLSEDLNRLSIIRARLNLRLDFALDKISKLESRWPHGESPEERFEHYISNTIDRAPEPLRRLGNWLCHVLDEDQWTTAERMLTGACVAAEERAAAQTQHSVPEGWKLVPVEPTEDVLEAIHNGGYVGDDQELRWFYQSILAAAPAPGGE
ncbi:hypothetical protein KUT50_19675 [Pseudomonas aeruginosa]|uniref:hypothetical protein n=1 Tax=Pseudomonas aeruginosa TaxID=287 RepID=UPI000AD04D33|nr:hypothetical protein [Pseudomonas aeruginosa]EKU1969271.1 hypothetical protein [Pseudomonas aeruginosa]EKX9350433.1 hypothetical protein [Pseudomonas aeruginosa]MBG7509796.1 hypothetical protein [Pseudomonas aeruginosa]MBH4001741.1 hypothetical protein [Pseudomonas aeruginosa]MBH9508717.1 hypothetical protein [Pseudomonas aeruginosa]